MSALPALHCLPPCGSQDEVKLQRCRAAAAVLTPRRQPELPLPGVEETGGDGRPPKGCVLGLPDHAALGVGQHLRGVQVVGVHEVGAGRGAAAVDYRQRQALQPDVLHQGLAGGAVELGEQLSSRAVQVMGSLAAAGRRCSRSARSPGH